MMNIIKNVVGIILGFQAGSSASNKTAGIINYAAFIPVLVWIWAHKANTIELQLVLEYREKLETIHILQTTFGGLSIILGAVFIYLEFLRRSFSGLRLDPPVNQP